MNQGQVVLSTHQEEVGSSLHEGVNGSTKPQPVDHMEGGQGSDCEGLLGAARDDVVAVWSDAENVELL